MAAGFLQSGFPTGRVREARLLLAVGLVFAWLFAPPTATACRPPNGSFNVDTAGWAPVQDIIELSWSPEDVDEDGESGSGLGSNVSPSKTSTATVGSAAQCVAVAQGGMYYLSGWILIDPELSPNRTGVARFRLVWYPGNGCSGLPINPSVPVGGLFGGGGTPGSWEFQRNQDPIVAPSGAVSVAIWLEVSKPVLGETLSANFDEIQLTPEPALAWMQVSVLAALGLAARRRAAKR